MIKFTTANGVVIKYDTLEEMHRDEDVEGGNEFISTYGTPYSKIENVDASVADSFLMHGPKRLISIEFIEDENDS